MKDVWDYLDNLKEGQAEILNLLKAAQKEPKEKTYDSSDIMRLLHVSSKTLAKWRTENKISYTKVGAKYYYSQSDLDDFIVRNKVNYK